MLKRRARCLAGLSLFVLLLPQIGIAQGLEKIRIVYASRGLPFFSAFVAKELKFYQKHGLDVELIQMAPRIALTALATSQVDYSLNIGSSLRAAMRGGAGAGGGIEHGGAILRFSDQRTEHGGA